MGTQRTSFSWTPGMWRAHSTPRWEQVASRLLQIRPRAREKEVRAGALQADAVTQESKQQKGPLLTTNTAEKARRNEEEGFCNSAHCESKRPRSSWDPGAGITFLKGSPEENQDCHAVSTSLQTSLPITYADMSSGVHNFLKSSPNGVPLKNSHQLSLTIFTLALKLSATNF